MKTSQNGIDLIKSFEGCRLEAYKPVPTEKYYTIGYGHYGADVTQGMVISLIKAEKLLKNDLKAFEKVVARSVAYPMNQNQFDALVSFAYNCGHSNLKMLVRERTLKQIGMSLPKYNKSNGKVLKGLTIRRKKEKKLYFTKVK